MFWRTNELVDLGEVSGDLASAQARIAALEAALAQGERENLALRQKSAVNLVIFRVGA